MQVELRADQKPAALKEAEACVRAGKASSTHGRWLATAWRYYGMLLALTGKMPEALIALSNALDTAEAKPSDDRLALARSHDALGRTLLELGKPKQAINSLKKAALEFQRNSASALAEARKTAELIQQLETDARSD